MTLTEAQRQAIRDAVAAAYPGANGMYREEIAAGKHDAGWTMTAAFAAAVVVLEIPEKLQGDRQ